MPWDRTTQKLSGLTDDGRAIAGPMPPKQGTMGRPRGTGLQSVFDGGRHIVSTGRHGAGVTH